MDWLLWILAEYVYIKRCTHNCRGFEHGYVIIALMCVAMNYSFVLASRRSRSQKDSDHIATVTFEAELQNRGAFIKTFDDDANRNPQTFTVFGSYHKLGSESEARGTIYQMPNDGCGFDDDVIYSKRPKDWIALFHLPQIVSHLGKETDGNETRCQAVTDRMKNAMIVGASAILILVLNPNVAKELDLAQLFSQPVILIQTATNVTAIVEALLCQLKWKVKIAAQKIDTIETVTVWSTCWRSRPGSGVVCRADSHLSKEDPGHFWNYFFSLLATLILLMILKTNGEVEDDYDNLDQGQALRRMAVRALAVMTIKRFKPNTSHQQARWLTGEMCAICLENFYLRQRLRVLPCSHEFHTKCVDPWLIKQPTCPLCKLNIIEQQLQQQV